jgi:TIR domain
MPKTKHSLNIFLCHAHSDRETVHALYSRLLANEVHAWLDSEDLQPGQNWQHEIRRAILNSDVVLVCLSQRFNEQQGYRHEEVKLALEKANLLEDGKIFIIPVRLEKCDMPESLSHLHRVDLFEPTGFKKLLRALKRVEDVG